MGLHLEPTYWTVVVGVAVWLRAAPARGTTAFGVANAVALGVLCGPAVAVAGLTLAGFVRGGSMNLYAGPQRVSS